MPAHELELEIGASTLDARVRAGDKVMWAAVAQFESLTELEEAIAELAPVPDIGRCRAGALLLMKAPWCQVRELSELPPVSVRRLQALVSLQPFRYFRKVTADVSIAAAWTAGAGGTDGQRRQALAGALDGQCAEAVISGAQRAGIRVGEFRSVEQPALTFLPARLAAERRSQARRATIRAAVLAGLCCAVAAVSVTTVRAREGRAFEASIDRIRPVALAAAAARQQVAAGASQLDSVAASIARRGDAARALSAAMAALGDSAHLTEFEWTSDGSGAFGGAAVRAADVLDRLATQDYLPKARLVSVSERAPTPYGSREGFRIEFDTRGSGQ